VLETILLNLSKGTGLAGLRGIKPKQGHIVRPLLFATRLQIESYAQDQNLTWREDASNASDKYQRNLIRHQVVPLLQKINPNLEQTLGNNLLRLASTERVFEQAVADLKNQSVQTKDGNVLIQLPITEVALLNELLKDFGFNFQQSKTIFAGQNGLVGKQFFSEKYTATLDRNCLIVSMLKQENNFELYIENTSLEDDFMVNTPAFNLGFSTKNTENVSTPDFAKIDASQLIWPLKLRTWQAGDVFCPLGMKGKKKKVSDFLIDLKIPRNLKKDTYILQNGNDAIIWIIGLRLDERFKIQENTQKVLTVRIYDGNRILT
jgi:tRNA(Ile)-lysidine synthase